MPDNQRTSIHERPIGLVGLGLMGSAIARRLMDRGFAIVGFDVDPQKCVQLTQAGGTAVASVADVARQADHIFLAVFDTTQVEEVVEDGIISAMGAAPNKIVLVTSTCDPDRIEALAARVSAHGLRMLDTPISGSSQKVALGEGVVLIGGEQEAADIMAPVLEALFSTLVRVGAVGNGGRAKLAINLVSGLHRLVLAEGLVFAEGLGLDPGDCLEVLKSAASYSRTMDAKGSKMVQGDFAPLGRVRQHLKDVQLILMKGGKSGQRLPLSELHAEILQGCIDAGEGDLDNSIVINEVKRRAVTPGSGR